MAASVIDLRPSTSLSSQRTEILHHHHHYQPYNKLGSHTLNKTNEHCRSLFNLLPTSLRPRHHHHHRQTSNKKGVEAVSIVAEEKERKGSLLHHIVVVTNVVTLYSSIISTYISSM